jgi:putative spermidine/putrescine transport system ATP-binding protein
MAFLELSGVVKRFGKLTVVDGFDLAAEEGEFVSFLGGSGCGKTTTLRMVAGFETPTAGSIRIAGTEIVPVAPNKRGVGMVFQNYALFPNMTVRRNIEFGLKVAKWNPADIRQRVAEMLALIHMEDLGERYPHQMSGGQQQRAALARALAVRPRVLLLDEPLSALDAKIRGELRTEIRAIQQKLGITTIYVTHDQEEALSLSDRIVVMRTGRIEQVGTPFEIYNRPANPFVASFIGQLNVLDAVALDPAQGRLAVAGQEVLAAGPLAAGLGQPVKLSLRPEMLSLEAAGGDGNHLAGTLANIVFLGSIVRLTVDIGDRQVVLDRFNAPHLALPELGSPVRVGFPREACLVDGTVPEPAEASLSQAI